MIDSIIKQSKTYLKHFDENLIQKAFLFAKKAHEGQQRYSGDPYIIHPVEATKILLNYGPDMDSICACLLHDVPENTPYSLEEIHSEFGPVISELISGFVNLSKIHKKDEDNHADVWGRMFFSLAEDLRVILIKFCERLHNLRTLQFVPREKQKRIAKESLEVYAPIAARLGIYKLKKEMEDICFQFLYPKDYDNIRTQVMEQRALKEDLMKKVADELKVFLKKEHITAEVFSRLKDYYSIYLKIKRKNKNFVHELYDLLALRVILDDKILPDGEYDDSVCYTTLGIIHKHYSPLSFRFKDYIALPKENGYRSLHTAVMGLGGKQNNQPTEIQIRTRQMHDESEVGVAAHWEYKEGGLDLVFGKRKQEWVRSLTSLKKYMEDASVDFSEDLRIDIFHDRIFVLTPQGDVRDLPKGATPIDFAYSIHTDIGHKFRGAKVNGKIVPLDYKLRNGEVVEILTKKEEMPNLYWLSSTVTQNAKNKIKAWFNRHNRDHLIALGKELVNKYLRRYDLPLLGANLGVIDKISEKKATIKEKEDVLEKVGQGSLSAKDIVKKLMEKKKPARKAIPRVTFGKNDGANKRSEVLIRGEKGYETRIAHCCTPCPGDSIKGYTTSKAISIHKESCHFLLKLSDKQRDKIIDVSWEVGNLEEKMVNMLVDFDTGHDVLSGILRIFRELGIDLKAMQTQHNKMNSTLLITVEVPAFEQFHTAFDRIENLTGVQRVAKQEIDD